MISTMPNMTGRLMVIAGIRGPCTLFVAFFPVVGAKLRPQTVHLAALSFSRVPQVGHTFVELVVCSGLIGPYSGNFPGNERKLYHIRFCQRFFEFYRASANLAALSFVTRL
jgi:hypothetical protein